LEGLRFDLPHNLRLVILIFFQISHDNKRNWGLEDKNTFEHESDIFPGG
jgi:hypothetical protein